MNIANWTRGGMPHSPAGEEKVSSRRFALPGKGVAALAALCALLLGLTGAGWWQAGERSLAHAAESKAKAATAQGSTGEAPPATGTYVEVTTLQPRDFTLQATYVGHLLPWERVQLKAEVEGTVEGLFFEEGEAVEPGNILARVSTDQFTLRRDLARSDLYLAEANFKRDEDLASRKLIPQSRLDLGRNQRDVAKLRLGLAEIDLAKSQPQSPIEGFVKTKGVEKGEFVNKGTLIAEILNTRRLRAVFNVPEREVRHLKAGKVVMVGVDALPGEDFSGTVRLVGLEADLKTRTFPVEAELDNARGRLRPGMLSRVQVELARHARQVLVPRHAVLERELGRVVFIVREGRALERTVRTGASTGGEVQILAGLAFGDQVVVTGQQKLVPNEPVQIVGKGR